MNKYRIKEYNHGSDLFLLQKRYLLFLWVDVDVGSKEELENKVSLNRLLNEEPTDEEIAAIIEEDGY